MALSLLLLLLQTHTAYENNVKNYIQSLKTDAKNSIVHPHEQNHTPPCKTYKSENQIVKISIY